MSECPLRFHLRGDRSVHFYTTRLPITPYHLPPFIAPGRSLGTTFPEKLRMEDEHDGQQARAIATTLNVR
ncbi:hypothetical protein CEXT_472881 [Caerostris extrusa]|uniref:Uncharacterized protein n=1 Tax=Caerostris extrusa TaxID=172846 RepID=A0AAV4XB97_CAEEX|nr:hypothetical protein CEXT_472881 [Caerostris extrusa]